VPNLLSVLRFRSYPIAKIIKRKHHSIKQLASNFMDATRQTDIWNRETNHDYGINQKFFFFNVCHPEVFNTYINI